MKRILSLLLVIGMVLSMVPAVFAVTLSEGDFTYTVSEGTATITGYTGAGGDVTIPSTLGGYPVTTIGDSAFYPCSSLTSVAIPDSVTAIGSSAFGDCENLTSVTIGSSVTTIGDYAFCGCISLTSATIGDSVESIGAWAFGGCMSLTEVYYGDTQEQWNKITIQSDNECLTNATIHFVEKPDTDYEYTVENGEATITGYTGAGGDVTIPSTLGGYPVTTIGDSAFWALALTSVTIPDSVVTIGKNVFTLCDSLTDLTIGDSVTTIGDSAFFCCRGLTSVTIGDSVTTIGNYAFYDCTSLTDVYYGDTQEQWNKISIGESNQFLLNATIHFVEDMYTYAVANGEATITGYTGAGGDVTIPSELGGYPVTAIGEDAFNNLASLTSVVIPDSVVTIGDNAFFWCENLQSVTLGNRVQTIGASAFAECALSTIAFPDSVTTIGSYAFHWCSLKSVHLPASVTELGQKAFFECGAPAVWVAAENPAYSNDADGNLYNKDKTVFIQAHTGISGEYVVPDSVKTIAASAFEGCNQLTAVIVPADVTIGSTAFDSCQALTAILFKGDAVVETDAFNWVPKLEYAFCYFGATIEVGEGNGYLNDAEWGSIRSTETVQPTCTEDGYIDYICGRLEPTYRQTLKAPGHTEEILPAVAPTEAASGLTEGKKCSVCGEILTPQEVLPMLTYYTYKVENGEATITDYEGNGGAITIPATLGGYPVTAIGEDAFSRCDSLTSVTIGDSVESIGAYAFFDCASLTDLTIGNSVTTIGDYAFCFCYSLTSATIGDSVESIGAWAFEDCMSLTDVYYGDTQEQWNKITIQEGNECLTNATIYFSEHTHRLTSVVTAPTCTEPGYTTYTCSGCDYSYTDDFVAALGHTEEITPAVAPTCKDTGLTEGKKCSACGKILVAQETVAALGHNYEDAYFDAVDGNPDYTLYTCTRCGDSYKSYEAPVITTQPVNDIKAKGKIATFTVVAQNVVSYQWQRVKLGATAWTNISGATGATYSVTVSSGTIIPYRCVLTDVNGKQHITDEVTIIEPAPLVKVTNTAGNQHVIKNSSISFTVELSSTEGVTYQWQRCKTGNVWTNVSYAGNQTKTVTFNAASWAQFPFRCEITDANGTKIYTDSYTYTLIEPPVAPAITSQPKDVNVLAGGTATFSVTAKGSDLTYQWWRSRDGGASWGDYTGAGNTTSSISLKIYSGQEYLYMCEVKDGYGNTMKTKIVQPHVITSVKITAQPTVTVEDGTATFTFTATGDVKTYQWQRLKTTGWVNANNDASYINNDTTTMTTAVAGTFRCRITDLAGNITYTQAVTFTK